MTDKRIATWDEMAFAGIDEDLVKLPALSEQKGEDVFCKVRGLAPIELVKCYNMPLAEVDQLAADDPTGAKLQQALSEQVHAMDPQELLDTIERVIHAGLIEPKPDSDAKMVDRLGPDVMEVFRAIAERTTGAKEAVADAADFREEP